MAQGISPNNLNKISEVYLSQISEHHKKDADGNTIPHEDELNEVSKKTLGNYIKKASTDLATRSIKHGMSGGTETGGDPDSPKNVDKINKRHSGIMKAADKLKKEEVIPEAKVDKGRSDYGKASIRNYRRMGPGYGEPGMFDPEQKRGKTIEKRREEHKARRGVKGAKVPAYKVDEGSSYGLYRGSGKPSGAMKDYLDRKAKMLKKKKKTGLGPAFDDPSHHSNAKNRTEQVTFQQFQEKCWPGYEKKGMKTMFGKRYPNCVKKKK